MKKRVLLAATAADIVQSVAVTLTLAGHDVQSTACGLEAIKLARETLPDLVVVDATLPDMDGGTVVEILSQLPSTANLRTIALNPRDSLQLHTGKTKNPQGWPIKLLPQIARVLELCKEESSPEPEVKWFTAPHM